jgi:hypothetical protein
LIGDFWNNFLQQIFWQMTQPLLGGIELIVVDEVAESGGSGLRYFIVRHASKLGVENSKCVCFGSKLL